MSNAVYEPAAGVDEVYAELAAGQGRHHDLGSLRVTHHARQRYLERVDGEEPLPRSRIAREVREADPVTLRDQRFDGQAVRHRDSGVVYVLSPDRDAVVTCLQPTDEQLPGRGRWSA